MNIALGHTTSFAYDHNGRLTVTTDAEDNITITAYDNVGNVAAKTDGNDQTTEYSYDEFNRLTTVTNAKDETTSYTYDLNGNLLTQTDGAGNVTAFEYNAANLLTRLIAPGGRTGIPGDYSYDLTKVERYTYTASGQLADKIDENGHTTVYAYDSHNRKLSETCGTLVISYTYDNNGNVLTITDSTGTTTRTYDAFNRVLTKTVPNLGASEYVYDITANLTAGCWAETSEDPSGNITQKSYDPNGRLWQVNADGGTTTYAYYDNGSVQSVLYPDGTSETYTYFDDNRLETLINRKADNTIVDSYSYTYDSAGNILTKTDGSGTTTYTYDELNRLLSETTSARAKSFTYDAAGNRSTETLAEGGDTTATTYTCNALNRLTGTSTTLNGVTAETVDYAYDNSGNILTKTQTVYDAGIPQTPVVLQTNTYDALNQLTSCTTADGTSILNTYNGEGLRVEKTVDGTATRFLYEAGKVVAEYDGSNTLKAQNIYGLNLLVRIGTSDSYYYLYNGHADVTALLNADTGAIDSTYYYDAFGNILSQTSTVDNSILYSGYQYDQETGLYYLNARMYDPAIARFLQEDTYRGDPNDPLSLNLYAYCANNPLIYSDPTGHRSLTTNAMYTDSGKNRKGNLYTKVQQAKGNHEPTSGVVASADGGGGNGLEIVAGVQARAKITPEKDEYDLLSEAYHNENHQRRYGYLLFHDSMIKNSDFTNRQIELLFMLGQYANQHSIGEANDLVNQLGLKSELGEDFIYDALIDVNYQASMYAGTTVVETTLQIFLQQREQTNATLDVMVLFALMNNMQGKSFAGPDDSSYYDDITDDATTGNQSTGKPTEGAGSSIKFGSDTKSSQKLSNQMTQRG